MSPSILLSKDRESMMVLGASGGSMITSAIAQVSSQLPREGSRALGRAEAGAGAPGFCKQTLLQTVLCVCHRPATSGPGSLCGGGRVGGPHCAGGTVILELYWAASVFPRLSDATHPCHMMGQCLCIALVIQGSICIPFLAPGILQFGNLTKSGKQGNVANKCLGLRPAI